MKRTQAATVQQATSPRTASALAPAVVTLASLTALLFVLVVGRTRVGIGPEQLGDVALWFDGARPGQAGLAGAWLLALLIGAVSTAGLAVSVGTRLVGASEDWIATADRWLLPPLRRVVRGTAGIGLAASAATTAVSGGAVVLALPDQPAALLAGDGLVDVDPTPTQAGRSVRETPATPVPEPPPASTRAPAALGSLRPAGQTSATAPVASEPDTVAEPAAVPEPASEPTRPTHVESHRIATREPAGVSESASEPDRTAHADGHGADTPGPTNRSGGRAASTTSDPDASRLSAGAPAGGSVDRDSRQPDWVSARPNSDPAMSETRPDARISTADIDDSEEVWEVARCESFWSIAEQVVNPGGAPDAEPKVADYWERLVDANRSRLIDPNDPDLLLPGQIIELPPPGLGDDVA